MYSNYHQDLHKYLKSLGNTGKMKLQGIDTSTFMIYDPIIDDPAIGLLRITEANRDSSPMGQQSN